jgi:hypothetical protein
MNAEEQLHFDGREMLMVHDVFRREFALMPALVRGVAVGDHNRAQIVTDHIERVSALLHHHHLAERQYTWPCCWSASPITPTGRNDWTV